MTEVVAGNPPPSRPKSLGERLSWITGQLAPIEATGHNRFSKAALSVEDVEDALRPLFAEAGVVALWSITGWESSPDKEAAWLVKFHVTLMRAEENTPLPDVMILPKDSTLTAIPQTHTDRLEADWFDVGSSPMAAQSFAVKGFYRRLFHLASAEDESKQAAGPAKPKNVREAVKQIAQTYGDPAQSVQEATPPHSPGDGTDPTPAPAELLSLGVSLKEPWHEIYLKQELAKHGEAAVRRRLVMLHARDHGPACDHVAQLAGLKS
jgi:hypothetical protein